MKNYFNANCQAYFHQPIIGLDEGTLMQISPYTEITVIISLTELRRLFKFLFNAKAILCMTAIAAEIQRLCPEDC